MKPKLKTLMISLVVLLMISAISTYVIKALDNQDRMTPDNPLLEQADGYSEVPLFSNHSGLIRNEDLPEEETDANQGEEGQDDEERDRKGQNGINENQDDEDAGDNNTPDNQQRGKKTNQESHSAGEDAQDETGSASPDKNDQAVHKEIVDSDLEQTESKKDENHSYFTTTIKQGESVTDEVFSFQVEQLDHDVALENVTVQIDSDDGQVEEITDDYTKPVHVRLMLAEGENDITVTATYQDDSGTTFDVFKTYTVIYDEDDIVIETTLKDMDVTEEELTFTAAATQGGQPISLKAVLEDGNDHTELKESEENTYTGTLEEGENKIILSASSGGKEVEESYSIHYTEPHQAEVWIDTDLGDYDGKTVKEETLNFSAAAYADDDPIDIQVHHNHQAMTSDDDSYQATLEEGENTFDLKAEEGGISQSESYTIYYEPEASGGDEEEEPDENAPEISVFDITDGETINNSIRTFHIKVKDFQGDSITETGNISVTNNGEDVSRDWTDKEQISFTLPINEGTNEIVIHAEDLDGNKASKELTIIGDVGEDGSPIGTATVSMEATTVGLDYLIPPHEVELYQGERASMVLDRVLKEYGFDYMNTGTLESDFYLEAVMKTGVASDVSIPEDLLETLEEHHVIVDETNFHPDILGEFDFTGDSGWMYSINGIYANVGFADYYLKDGDELRIRFTLAEGNDIGLGLNNFHKEW